MTVQPDLGTFRPVPRWPRIPHGMSFCGDATSVAVDSEDNVYVFNRGPQPVMIFDAAGNFVTSWGVGEFERPHGIAIDTEDHLYLVDDAGHVVEKRTREGKLILTIGVRGESSESYSGRPFNRPTDVAINPATGDLFIADGYFNAAIHKYDPGGRYLQSWGEPGSDAGEFCCPHSISMVGTDRVVVCDRENFRLQFFSTEGEFIEQRHVFHPTSVRQATTGNEELFVAEMGPPAFHHGVPNLGNRVTVFDPDSGAQLERFGSGLPGTEEDQFLAPHGMAIDSSGNVYIAEVSHSYLTLFLGQTAPPGEVVSLRKWTRDTRAED